MRNAGVSDGILGAGLVVSAWKPQHTAKRVMWNWKWNSDNYPQLDSRIKQWKRRRRPTVHSLISAHTSPVIEPLRRGGENTALLAKGTHGRLYLRSSLAGILWRRGRSDQKS